MPPFGFMKILALLCGLALAGIAAMAAEPNIQTIPINDLDGKPTSLKAYKGKTVLLVNVASKCGYTPQYKGLEGLYRKYKDKGLVVVGVPCDDFGHQEPGSPEEIKKFCSENYDVSFPLLEKIHVKGPEQHPLYSALTGKDSPAPGNVSWNFNKYLISPEGKIIAHYDSKVAPDSPELISAIEKNLPKK
jgi:glutathione peroxidase